MFRGMYLIDPVDLFVFILRFYRIKKTVYYFSLKSIPLSPLSNLHESSSISLVVVVVCVLHLYIEMNVHFNGCFIGFLKTKSQLLFYKKNYTLIFIVSSIIPFDCFTFIFESFFIVLLFLFYLIQGGIKINSLSLDHFIISAIYVDLWVFLHFFLHVSVYIYMFIILCLCVCVFWSDFGNP